MILFVFEGEGQLGISEDDECLQGKPADNRVVHYAKREIWHRSNGYIQQPSDEVCEAKWKCVHTEQFPYLHLWIYEVGNQIFKDKVRAVLASLALLQKYPGREHCTLQIPWLYLFTFYLFTFWGQGGRPEDLEEGNSHFGHRGEEHCTLQKGCFYLFTFYLFTFWGRTEDLEEGNSHSGHWGRALHIANLLFLPFYLLPFYLAPISELYK